LIEFLGLIGLNGLPGCWEAGTLRSWKGKKLGRCEVGEVKRIRNWEINLEGANCTDKSVNFLKVLIGCNKLHAMFQSLCRDPYIIGWNGCSLSL